MSVHVRRNRCSRSPKSVFTFAEIPNFIEYAVVDTESTVLEATFGASVRNDQTHMRSLRVDVRVGSHELDNSEFVAVPSFIQIGRFPRNLVRDQDYDALRHDSSSDVRRGELVPTRTTIRPYP